VTVVDTSTTDKSRASARTSDLALAQRRPYHVIMAKKTPTLPEMVRDAEREIIERVLAEHNGNRTHAAKALGISRRTLQYKLKEHWL
jgi:transcriptional regulator with PAS, ATPase and Fis domain